MYEKSCTACRGYDESALDFAQGSVCSCSRQQGNSISRLPNAGHHRTSGAVSSLRSHQDIAAEIQRLELEREVVKLERGGASQPTQQIIIQDGIQVPYSEYNVVKFKPGHHKKKSSSGGDLYYVDNEYNYRPAEREKKGK